MPLLMIELNKILPTLAAACYLCYNALDTPPGAWQADISRITGDGTATTTANRLTTPAVGHQGATFAFPQIARGTKCCRKR